MTEHERALQRARDQKRLKDPAHRARRKKYHASWKKANPDKVATYQKGSRLKRVYGMSLSDYQEMSAAQGGKCAICSDVPSKARDLCVDHCHTTGRVRQLLCRTCNMALGKFKESKEVLQAAIAYLERWS